MNLWNCFSREPAAYKESTRIDGTQGTRHMVGPVQVYAMDGEWDVEMCIGNDWAEMTREQCEALGMLLIRISEAPPEKAAR